MMNRRDAIGSLAFLAEVLAHAGAADAQVPAGGTTGQAARPPVFKHDLPGDVDERVAVAGPVGR